MKTTKISVPFSGIFKMQPYSVWLPKFTWNEQGKRILFVTDKVSRDEVKFGMLLTGDLVEAFLNITDWVQNKTEGGLGEAVVINFPAFKHWKLSPAYQPRAEEEFVNRILKFAKKYQPDCIVWMGEYQHYFIKDWKSKIGRIHNITTPQGKFKFLGTLSLHETVPEEYSKIKVMSNLLGFLCRHIETAVNGRNKYTLDEENIERNIIRTIPEFNAFFKKLLKCPTPCIDTETANLNRVFDNTLLSIQFALDSKTTYFLPMDHKDTPFSSHEMNYIKEKLRLYFEHHVTDYTIYHNAKFDLLQFKQHLGVRYLCQRIYDTQSGEFALEENRKFLRELKIRTESGGGAYSLDFLINQYGAKQAYKNTAITKIDRTNMSKYSIEEIEDYGHWDVVLPYQIHEFQIKEAKERGYKKFIPLVTEQMSDMIHSFVGMESTGIPLDKKLNEHYATSKDSIFITLAKEIDDSFRHSEAAQQTNDILLQKKNIPVNTLFGTAAKPWLFSIGKVKPAQALFFDVLGLEGLSENTHGFMIDKNFIKEYKDTVPEVATLDKYRRVTKLHSTYAKSFYKKLKNNPDSQDSRLRPEFSYTGVLTGRASATDGLHQIPSRDDDLKLTKHIKKQFIAPKGYIIVKQDYSAHEVRNLGLVAHDPIVVKTFKIGFDLRIKYRLAKSKKLMEKIKAKLEEKGDIHILNVKFFFNQKVDKKHHLRYAVKAVVFGVIYGKGAPALGAELNDDKKKLTKLNEEIKELKAKNDDKAKLELYNKIQERKEIKSHDEEHWTEYAQSLIDKLFENWHDSGEWLRNTIARAGKEFIAVSPIGRVRHLWAYLHPNMSARGLMNRRGPNSIIQGVSSDEGYCGSRAVQNLVWELFQKKGINFTLKQSNSVHDSSENLSHLLDLPMSMYILEHAFTTEVHRKYKKVFSFEMMMGLEVEAEVGPALSEMQTWDGRFDSLPELAEKAMQWMNDNLKYNLDIPAIMKDIRHNCKVVQRIREKELKKTKSGAPKIRLITKENSHLLDYRFAYPRKESLR